MTNNRSISLKEMLLEEAWSDLEEPGQEAIDKFLTDVGIAPDSVTDIFNENIDAATRAQRRQRYENAKQVVRATEKTQPFKIVSFDLSTKQKILARIQDCVTGTGAMTIAARNRTNMTENDMDSFLEACIRLGVIDDDGNLNTAKE